MSTQLSARNLSVGEEVYVVIDGELICKAEIVSFPSGKKEQHYAGDELNESVNVRSLDTNNVASIDNQDIYKIVPGKTFKGEEVCYEHNLEVDYPYYCPARDENCYEIELD